MLETDGRGNPERYRVVYVIVSKLKGRIFETKDKRGRIVFEQRESSRI